MKQLLSKLFDRSFRRFLLVGIVNTAFGSGIMFLFYNVFHLSYWISSASNYIFGSILSYFLNRFYTFQSAAPAGRTVPRFVLNISLCYLLAYGIAKPLMRLLLSAAAQQTQENLAMLAGMCFFVGLNYLGQRFFVFSRREEKAAP